MALCMITSYKPQSHKWMKNRLGVVLKFNIVSWLSLGFVTNVKAWKDVGQECNRESHLYSWECEGMNSHCHNPNFGLATKAKGLQGCKPRENPEVTSHTPGSVGKCEGVNPHTPKATPTLGDGVPVDSQNFSEQFEGSELNGLWRSLYHWKARGT
jgi:hypothetical protein